jgi:hypothetical protein
MRKMSILLFLSFIASNLGAADLISKPVAIQKVGVPIVDKDSGVTTYPVIDIIPAVDENGDTVNIRQSEKKFTYEQLRNYVTQSQSKADRLQGQVDMGQRLADREQAKADEIKAAFDAIPVPEVVKP